MKALYTTVLVIVTAVCIIVGTICHVSGWTGITIFPFSWFSDEQISYSGDLEAFQSIKVDVSVFAVTVKEGDGYYLSFDCTNGDRAPEWVLEGGTLIVEQPSVHSIFDFGISGRCEMTLTVPKGVKLAKVDICSDVGNIILSGVDAEEMRLEMDVGNVTMTGCQGSRLEVESDMGNAEISACEFQETDIESDLGNVAFSTNRPIAQYVLELSTDLGEVTINGEGFTRQFNQIASGSSNACRLKVETDAGNIDISTAAH